ncbi:xylose operon transcription regulator XylR, partial [bacterium]
MKKRARVALIIETSGGYGRQILRGVSQYLKTHGGWSVFIDEGECIRPLPDWLPSWDGDGVICRATTPALAAALKHSNISVVNLNNSFDDLGLPYVASDMIAIGRMAAAHLLERGYRTMAYVGFDNQSWSKKRLAGVREALHGRGILHDVFETSSHGYRTMNWEEELEQLSSWVKALPHPIGIVACSDRRGQHVLEACRMAGVSVPDEVAVIGVDNIETFCELCQPPLSSVMPDGERVGYEAAALLSRLMHGDGPKT